MNVLTEKNPFVVIEALDAGGSQTQSDLLAERFKETDYRVLQLHFPQEDRATGKLIYEKFLLKKNEKPFTRREQALLYIQDFYSRAEDIRTALSSGETKNVVVSDRYCTSTMAYQTIGLTGQERVAMLEWLTWLCYEGTVQLPKPSLTLFLDTPVDVSLRRLAQKKKDYFETQEKLIAIRDSYLVLAKKQKWHVMSSVNREAQERTREELHEEIWQVVTTHLGLNP